jgi:hypothetical protein
MRRVRLVGTHIVLFGIVCVGIMGLVTVGLWNLLMPAILGLPAIGFWQALGLLLLSRLLFGRLGGWGRRLSRARFVRGWHDLTPDERQRFRRAMEQRRPEDLGKSEAAEKV